MSSLNSILDIAKTSLLASQKAISVTSHNISNANMPGYTRQTAVLEPMNPVSAGGLFFGTGVNVASIERVYDSFQATQLMDANSKLSRYDTGQGLMKTLESIIYDANGGGLSAPLDGLFNSFHDLAANPGAQAERSALLSNAAILTDRFNWIDKSIRQNLTNINNEIEARVNKLNSLAKQVAELNNQISTVEIAGVTANDLRDKRDLLLKSISDITDISVRESKTGAVDVCIAGGSFLVSGVKSSPVTVGINGNNPYIYDIMSNGSAINGRMSGGALKGLIDSSNEYQDTLGKLNKLASAIVKEVNVAHRSGYGLDGSTGVDFFDPATVYTKSAAGNTGGATISAGVVTDQSLLTLDDYEIRFSGPAAYTVVNKNSNAVVLKGVYTSGTPITFEGLSVNITDFKGAPAAGDTFTVSSTMYAAQNIRVAVTDNDKIAASSSASTLPGDNTNALKLADIKNSKIIHGSTLNQYFNALAAGVGTASNNVSTNMNAQGKVVEELQMARDSVSGVSLEEEAINLVKLQKAYEAAAKVMGTADKLFDTLLSLR